MFTVDWADCRPGWVGNLFIMAAPDVNNKQLACCLAIDPCHQPLKAQPGFVNVLFDIRLNGWDIQVCACFLYLIFEFST